MDLTFAAVAVLFSAIPVTFVVYAQTSFAIGARIATIYEKYRSEPLKDELMTAYKEEIRYLSKRATLIRTCQLVAVAAFVINMFALFGMYAGHQLAAKVLYAGAVVVLLISILVYGGEIAFSLTALRKLAKTVSGEGA